MSYRCAGMCLPSSCLPMGIHITILSLSSRVYSSKGSRVCRVCSYLSLSALVSLSYFTEISYDTEYDLLCCNALQFGRTLPTFRRKVLLPAAVTKSKSIKKPARSKRHCFLLVSSLDYSLTL
jgi:hypothetical protein